MVNEVVLITGILLGNCTITSYRSIPTQTDNSPYYTSIGERVHQGGVAISRDLICPVCRHLHRRCGHKSYLSKIHYDDYLYIDDLGLFKVNDVMGETQYDKITHKRVKIRNHFDVWVHKYEDEKKIGTRYKDVYVIKRKIK